MTDYIDNEVEVASIDNVTSSVIEGTEFPSQIDVLNTKTLGQGYALWSEDYRDGKCGEYVKNTHDTVAQNWTGHILPFFGKDTLLADLSVSDIEDLMDELSFAVDKDGKAKLSDNGVLVIWYSGRRVFRYLEEHGYVADNLFDQVDRSCVPRPQKGNKKTMYLDDDSSKVFVSALLNLDPEFSAVKAVCFAYLAYKLQLAPGKVSLLTGERVDELVCEGKLDDFIIRLLKNYRTKLAEDLQEQGIVNTNGYLFVQKGSRGDEAEPADGGSSTKAWLKKHVIEPSNGAVPDVRMDSLKSKNTSRAGLSVVDPQRSDYKILGDIYVSDYLSGGRKRLSQKELEAMKTERENRRARYLARQNSMEENNHG